MSEAGEGTPKAEPVRTVNQLVEALRRDPPELFKGTTKPLHDMRGRREDIYFTLTAMNDRFASTLRVAKDMPLAIGNALHFGQSYKTATRDIIRDPSDVSPLILARSIVYNDGELTEDGIFHPYQTLGLYSFDPDELRSIGIELTQYSKILDGEEEAVNIYQIMQGANPRNTAIRGSSFNVQKREFTESQVFVGAPYLTDEDAYRHAKLFGLTSGSHK